jgi:glutathione S-transferase
MKVSCYLAYKKLDYQFVGVNPLTYRQVAFTNKRQVPVIQINDEWKLESSEIGMWLEARYPGDQLLGISEADQAAILELDKWVSDKLIPSLFRITVDWPSIGIGLKNGWKLARAVNQATPIPFWALFLWPVLIRKAKFITAMMVNLNRSEKLEHGQKKLVEQFITHLDGGPFLGGMSTPTLADLSAFSIIVFPDRFGLQGDTDWITNPVVVKWIHAVQKRLPENPFLVSSILLSREIP